MEGLRKPMQALRLAPDKKMWLATLFDEKKITIREGWRDYQAGPVAIYCIEESLAVEADIFIVIHTTLKDVTKEVYQADGFKTLQGMLRGLRRFYPDITWDSLVTVISWHNVRGMLVENRDKIKMDWLKSQRVNN